MTALYESALKKIKNHSFPNPIVITNSQGKTLSKSKILKLDISVSLENIATKYINSIFNHVLFEDFLEKYPDIYNSLSRNEKILLERYFYHKPIPLNQKVLQKAKEDINLTLLHYINCNGDRYLKMLYNTYINHQGEFSDINQTIIECFIFKTKDRRQFIEKYPNFDMYRILDRINYNKIRLEKIHLQLNGILWNRFTIPKKEVEKLLMNKTYKISNQHQKVLKLYYGIDCQPYTISDIAEILGEEKRIVHDRIFDANDRILKIYLSQNLIGKIIDSEIYQPYIENCQYELTYETRMILIKHLLEKKDYQTISHETGLSTIRISNIITDGIRKLDFYRFNIIPAFTINKESLKSFMEKHSTYQTKEKIIEYRYFDGKSLEEVVKITGETKKKLNDIYNNFERAYYRDITNSCHLTKIEIEDEIGKHSSDSILTELERQVLSEYYGIISTNNPKGMLLSISELSTKYKKSLRVIRNMIDQSKQKLYKNKFGFIKPEFGYFSREEIKEFLEDPHIPISDFEKELLQHLKELNGYSLLTLKELSEKYHITEGSIKRRYLRAILQLKKYQNGEIPGVYSYDLDIKPNKKYFCKYDQQILDKIYKDKIPLTQLYKSFHQTKDIMCNDVERIQLNLAAIIQNKPCAKRFDFDYAEEYIHSKTFKTFNKSDYIVNVYYAFFGEDGRRGTRSIPKLQKKLHLPFQESTIHKQLNEFLIYIQKSRLGIQEKELFTYEEILNYYNQNKDQLDNYIVTDLKKYFSRYQKHFYCSSDTLSRKTIYQIVCEKYPELPFYFKKINKKKAIELLNNKDYHFLPETKQVIKSYYHIQEREFMSGKEKLKAIKLLSELENLLLKETEISNEKIRTRKKEFHN